MFIILKLAWRNIWRNPRRTLLSLGAVSFASGVLVFFISLQLSTYETAINATIRVFSGHLQIQKQAYYKDSEIRDTIPNAESLRNDIADLPNVVASAVRGIAFAIVSSKKRTYGTQIVGIEPNYEPQVSNISALIRRGNYLSSVDAEEAILGVHLASNLNADVGDEVTLMGQGADGSLAATIVKVVGIFQTGSEQVDRHLIQIPLHTLQSVFSLGQGAHSIVIRAKNLITVPKLRSELLTLLNKKTNAVDPFVALDWEKLNPGLKQSIDLDMSSGWIFYTALIIVVVFCISNTFLMSVLERTKEFGMLLALGVEPFRISALIFIECLMLTIVGLGMGMILGSAFVAFFGYNGFSVPGSEEISKLWNLPTVIYPHLSFAALTRGPSVVFITAIFAIIYPAFHIHWCEPVESMRKV